MSRKQSSSVLRAYVFHAQQIPLEQMDEIFAAKSPRKYSLELAAQARIKAKAAQEATRA
jgi:hypothetical protein